MPGIVDFSRAQSVRGGAKQTMMRAMAMYKVKRIMRAVLRSFVAGMRRSSRWKRIAKTRKSKMSIC